MKTRDLIGLTIALVIIIVAGVLLYGQLAPAPKDSGIQVQIPQPVIVPLNSDADKTKLADIKALKDLSVPQKCDDDPKRCEGPKKPF